MAQAYQKGLPQRTLTRHADEFAVDKVLMSMLTTTYVLMHATLLAKDSTAIYILHVTV